MAKSDRKYKEMAQKAGGNSTGKRTQLPGVLQIFWATIWKLKIYFLSSRQQGFQKSNHFLTGLF